MCWLAAGSVQVLIFPVFWLAAGSVSFDFLCFDWLQGADPKAWGVCESAGEPEPVATGCTGSDRGVCSLLQGQQKVAM